MWRTQKIVLLRIVILKIGMTEIIIEILGDYEWKVSRVFINMMLIEVWIISRNHIEMLIGINHIGIIH